MAQAPQSWWSQFGQQYGPGLLSGALELGGGLLRDQRAASSNEALLRRAQGPYFDQQQQLAGQALTQAGNLDPRAMAAERFAAQQQLMAPGEEAQRQDLMRQLQRQGLLGLSSHAAVPGVVTTPGQPVNPYVASLLAAQQTQRARSAFDSLREGEQQVNQLINRSGALQGQALGTRAAGQTALQQAQISGRKPNITDTLLRGGLNILKTPQAQKSIFDLLKGVPGMLGLGGGGYTNPFSTTDFASGYGGGGFWE